MLGVVAMVKGWLRERGELVAALTGNIFEAIERRQPPHLVQAWRTWADDVGAPVGSPKRRFLQVELAVFAAIIGRQLLAGGGPPSQGGSLLFALLVAGVSVGLFIGFWVVLPSMIWSRALKPRWDEWQAGTDDRERARAEAEQRATEQREAEATARSRRLVDDPPTEVLKVAGTSHHQQHLQAHKEQLARQGGVRGPYPLTKVRLEPENSIHDRNAVRVMIGSTHVGYIPRERTPVWGMITRQIWENQGRFLVVPARIVGGDVGGDGQRLLFGLRLYLGGATTDDDWERWHRAGGRRRERTWTYDDAPNDWCPCDDEFTCAVHRD